VDVFYSLRLKKKIFYLNVAFTFIHMKYEKVHIHRPCVYTTRKLYSAWEWHIWTTSMKHCLSWRAVAVSHRQLISSVNRIGMFSGVFIRALYWTLSWASCIHSVPSHRIYVRPIWKLIAHRLPSVFSPSNFLIKISYEFASLLSYSPHGAWFNYSNIW
jgi:hypothetical protein